MKQNLLILCTSLLLALAACNGGAQDEAAKQAALIEKTTKESSPGAATSGTGAYMTAKIDGKQWTASTMTPDDNTSSNYKIITGDNDGDGIHFQLWKKNIEVGKKIPFSEDHAADLTLKAEPAFFGGRTGEVEITKLDEKWVEGTFRFTATSHSSAKKIEVTEGRFRVPIVPGLQ
jgi:hypothetical protein